jgi:uncharacterized membrane protein
MRTSPRRARFDVDTLVGCTLLAGVLASLGLIAAGLAWHWAVHGTLRLDDTLPATSVGGFVIADVGQLATAGARPRLLVNLGIGVLMLTPYVRVLVSLLYFGLAERNVKYARFTAFVLGTLTYGLFAA